MNVTLVLTKTCDTGRESDAHQKNAKRVSFVRTAQDGKNYLKEKCITVESQQELKSPPLG